MTDRAAQIQARLDAAALGPCGWRVCYWPIPEPYWHVAQVNENVLSSKSGPPVTGPMSHEGNAELIAHAPDDLRYLLGRVRELEQALTKIRDSYQDVPGSQHWSRELAREVLASEDA